MLANILVAAMWANKIGAAMLANIYEANMIVSAMLASLIGAVMLTNINGSKRLLNGSKYNWSGNASKKSLELHC